MMSRAKIVLISTLFVGGLLFVFLPTQLSAKGSYMYSSSAIVYALFDACVALGAAVLFIMALRSFKPQNRPPYRYMAAAILAYAITNLDFPYTEYNGLWGNLLLNCMSYLPYFLAAPLMYLGVRKLSIALRYKGRLTSIPLLVGSVAVLWLITVPFIPRNPTVWHINDTVNVSYVYPLMQIMTITPVVFFAAAWLLIHAVRRQTGKYRVPLGWLAGALALQLIAALSIAILEHTDYTNWFYENRVNYVALVLGDICLLIAAYAFCVRAAADTKQARVRTGIR